TNAEAAQRHWDERWHEAIPVSGRALPYALQVHVRGLTDEEAERIRTGEWDFEDVLGTDHSLHFDLRLATDRFEGLYGITLFGGSMEENRRQLRVERIDEEPILSAPKQWQPRQWLDVAKERPFLSPPQGVGATSRRWAAFFEIDRGTYRVGFARQHAVEFVFDGEVLRGRYLWQYAALDGRRAWLFTKPREQRLYAQLHDREAVEQEVRERGQDVFFWPRDPDDLAAGLVRVDVRHKFLRSVPEKRYTLSVAYPLREADAHGDAVASLDEMERMAWEYLTHSRRIGVEHEDGTDGAGTVVESYIYRGPRWEVNGQVVEEGDWLLGVVWDEPTWERIKRGELVGLSWQGWAWRKPHRKGVRNGERT
ncbi:MAG: XkdF-like putative serine protease domain-containing protein, partial [Dehalococcoidia bacterium]|nr:XkdF-like putative serine protease domain-containing protein [Dehalococcoidia bacterium]